MNSHLFLVLGRRVYAFVQRVFSLVSLPNGRHLCHSTEKIVRADEMLPLSSVDDGRINITPVKFWRCFFSEAPFDVASKNHRIFN